MICYKTFTFTLIITLLFVAIGRGDTRRCFRFKGGIPQAVSCPYTIEVHDRLGYTIGFSPELHQSLWVAYRLVPEDVASDCGRVGSFQRDDDLRQVLPPRSYNGSGYDRGHLAPSLDMRYDSTVSRQSFWMGNISPQTPHLNRGKWKQVEAQINRLVQFEINNEPRAREVFVIAGPIFGVKANQELNTAQSNQQQDVLIKPVAFYKIYVYNAKVVVLRFSQDGSILTPGPLREIERETGFSFFPEMREGLREIFLDMVYGTISH